MTCRPPGGACDLELRDETADDVIDQQDQHPNDVVAEGDGARLPAREDMTARWRRPVPGLEWYNATTRPFAELPED